MIVFTFSKLEIVKNPLKTHKFFVIVINIQHFFIDFFDYTGETYIK